MSLSRDSEHPMASSSALRERMHDGASSIASIASGAILSQDPRNPTIACAMEDSHSSEYVLPLSFSARFRALRILLRILSSSRSILSSAGDGSAPVSLPTSVRSERTADHPTGAPWGQHAVRIPNESLWNADSSRQYSGMTQTSAHALDDPMTSSTVHPDPRPAATSRPIMPRSPVSSSISSGHPRVMNGAPTMFTRCGSLSASGSESFLQISVRTWSYPTENGSDM